MPEARDHGPLPGLLLGLTVTTGLVDAVSYLALGHVFVANMTGNVVFLGFALSGIGGISWTSALLAVAAFCVGSFLGGTYARDRQPHRGRLLATGTVVQCCLVVAAATVATAADPTRRGVQLTLIALLALAMGIQNAVVRRLGVPDLTTTVLTQTTSALFAERTSNGVRARRVGSILAMLLGALVGGLLLRYADIAAPLWTAAGLLAASALAAARLSRAAGAESWG